MERTERSPLPFERETVRALILDTEGKILLLQKDKTSKTKYKWELPGGEVDLSLPATPEQLLSEVIREIEEETGLGLGETGESFGSLGHFDYVRKHKQSKSPTRINAFYILLDAEKSADNIVIDPNDNLRAYKWVTAEELREMQNNGKISSNSSKVIKHLLRPSP